LTNANCLNNTSQNKVKTGMKLEFDDIICAPRRLGILATLVPGEPVSFTEMKVMTSLSDGNLHVQSRKLAEAGYVDISKTKKGKRSVTHFSITDLGRERLREHVARLQEILDASADIGAGTSRTAAKSRSRPVQNAKGRRRKRPALPDDSAVWI
jgi:DNA-binding MarR family transcriptional regulator